jgi:hypothetical protein
LLSVLGGFCFRFAFRLLSVCFWATAQLSSCGLFLPQFRHFLPFKLKTLVREPLAVFAVTDQDKPGTDGLPVAMPETTCYPAAGRLVVGQSAPAPGVAKKAHVRPEPSWRHVNAGRD